MLKHSFKPSQINLFNTIIFFLITQFILFLFVSLIFSLNHPLFFLLEKTNINIYVITACLIMVPIYLLFGAIGIVVRDKHRGLRQSLSQFLRVMSGFYLVFLIGAIFLHVQRISDLFLQLYILANYPMGFVMNQLTENHDLIQPVLALTAIMPVISYYAGAIWRLNFLRKKAQPLPPVDQV